LIFKERNLIFTPRKSVKVTPRRSVKVLNSIIGDGDHCPK
jgi:hypothetical protein